jgi:hypothetical protein
MSREAALQALLDRQEIIDCLLRYTRGIDRMDRELLLSAYHPGAIDDHGPFAGPAEEFADWAIGFHQEQQISHHHIITNQTIDIEGDVAHAETYYLFIGRNKAAPHPLAFGRYLDRLEKRDGKWAIVFRRCINDLALAVPEMEQPSEWLALMASSGQTRRDKEDFSYERPLSSSRRTRV